MTRDSDSRADGSSCWPFAGACLRKQARPWTSRLRKNARDHVILSVHSPRAAHNLQQLDGRTVLQNSKDLRVELLQSKAKDLLRLLSIRYSRCFAALSMTNSFFRSLLGCNFPSGSLTRFAVTGQHVVYGSELPLFGAPEHPGNHFGDLCKPQSTAQESVHSHLIGGI